MLKIFLPENNKAVTVKMVEIPKMHEWFALMSMSEYQRSFVDAHNPWTGRKEIEPYYALFMSMCCAAVVRRGIKFDAKMGVTYLEDETTAAAMAAA